MIRVLSAYPKNTLPPCGGGSGWGVSPDNSHPHPLLPPPATTAMAGVRQRLSGGRGKGLFRQQNGQAMIESVGALGLLLFIFVCVYYTFLMAVDKIRSLDAAYHTARMHQVQENQGQISFRKALSIALWTFGRPAVIPVDPPAAAGLGPPIKQVRFRYRSQTFLPLSRPWESVMRVAMPHPDYLNSSWRGAREDPPAHKATLTAEALKVKGRVLANQDAILEAERG